MKKVIAAVYHSYGNPAEVLKAETIEVNSPKENEVLIKLLRAVINPSDMGMIGGSYGNLKDLPAVAGREGIGQIVEVGSSVKNFKEGDLVKMPSEFGVWRQFVVSPVDSLIMVPAGINLDDACMAFINPPTALRVLEDFVDLKQGDYVIQNGSNSALGFFMIQLCKARGIKTINMLRNAAQREKSLKAIGADIVIDENEFDAKKLKELCNGNMPKLGLNQIGGQSVSNMIKAMANSATLVTVGGMTGDLIRFPTRFLIFNDLSLRGFWWDKWQRTHTHAQVQEVFDVIFKYMRDGLLKAPVFASFDISDIEQAIKAAQQPRDGKILISNKD